MKSILLDGKWKLKYTNENEGREKGLNKTKIKTKYWLDAKVPGDVHVDLINAGLMEEPSFDLNSYKCKWVEDKEWWYKKEFIVPAGFIKDKVEIIFEGLDTTSKIWLNGKKIGKTNNAFIPHIIDVTKHIKTGKNVLTVRIDCGIWAVRGKPLKKYSGRSERIWIRKPQYVFGWDWAPRVVTCGIWRPVKLVAYDKVAIRSVFLRSKLGKNRAGVSVDIDLENVGRKQESLDINISLKNKKTHQKNLKVRMKPGKTTIKTKINVKNPKLWFPKPIGRPSLYKAKVTIKKGGTLLDEYNTKFGIREVELIQKRLPLPEGGKSFTIAINGQKVYCKGANWVPVDSIPARITKEKYKRLVEAAAEANLNMFRIWGGGIFEDKDFYELCDENGIMIYHDFMYACAMYPDDNKGFRKEVEKETIAALKILRNYACIIMWSGNNENHQGFVDKWLTKGDIFYGKRIYHGILPRSIKKYDNTRPYWPGSPYGGKDPNSESEGDEHFWEISLHGKLDDRINYWNFEKCSGKFVSEYGVAGMPLLKSVKKYLPLNKINFKSESWKHHINDMDYFLIKKGEKRVTERMIKMFYTEKEDLSVGEYINYSQANQAEGYKVSSEHFRRRKYYCSGNLFWMYSDCWGELGWTIIDYYLNLKPGYYYIKRAFQPILVSIKREDYGVSIWVVNDTLENYGNAKLEFGVSTLDGKIIKKSRKNIRIAANKSECFVKDFVEQMKRQRFYYVKLRINGKIISENRHFFSAYKSLMMPKANVNCKLEKKGNKKAILKVKTDNFAYFVNFDLPNKVACSDNYFDIFPNSEKKVILTGDVRKVKKIKVSWMNNKESQA